MLEILAALANDGKTSEEGVVTNPLLAAVLLREYEDEIYLARPPLVVQRVVFGALAIIGRLLGYRTEYPYPYAEPGKVSRIA